MHLFATILRSRVRITVVPIFGFSEIIFIEICRSRGSGRCREVGFGKRRTTNLWRGIPSNSSTCEWGSVMGFRR